MIARLARMHKALADETRLRMMHLLLSVGDLCVCDLEAALAISQSKASRHLQTLKQARLVDDRREATWVYYRISDELDETARSALVAVLEALGDNAQSQADIERARELRRSPRCAQPRSSATLSHEAQRIAAP